MATELLAEEAGRLAARLQGSPLRVIGPPCALDLNPSGSPALGDIDGDGRPEIVAVAEQGTQLLAFESDGTFKRRSPELEKHVGAAAPGPRRRRNEARGSA